MLDLFYFMENVLLLVFFNENIIIEMLEMGRYIILFKKVVFFNVLNIL